MIMGRPKLPEVAEVSRDLKHDQVSCGGLFGEGD